ncbi:AGAP000906-PA [Anopheles gambiae str. PEST]|uniref:AGAP000906-PA n=1 Tax=Anopheles gambiae TaxID=7165 RepID=Q7PNI3_ANOGA|nr:AGAP000906-PA [Anopheles gambiae str. PEST]
MCACSSSRMMQQPLNNNSKTRNRNIETTPLLPPRTNVPCTLRISLARSPSFTYTSAILHPLPPPPLMQQTTTRTIANTKMESQDGSAAVTTRTIVTTKTVASSAPKPMSPFAKFRQLDKQNSLSSQSPPNSPKTPSTPTTPSGAMGGPMFKFTDPALNRRAATVKDQLLQWCQMKTKEYENVKIENFSTSWSDGMAFCALIHHFLPDAFDFSKLTPQQRRHNFTLAFRVADEKAGIAPLLDVDDMVAMRKPDWKCVFTYVQSIYRRFKNEI